VGNRILQITILNINVNFKFNCKILLNLFILDSRKQLQAP